MAKRSVSFKHPRNFCKHQKEMELYNCVFKTFFSLIVALSTPQLALHPPNYFCRGNSARDCPWSIPTSACMSLTAKPRWRPITTDTPNSGHSHLGTEFLQGTTFPKKNGAQALLLHNRLQLDDVRLWRRHIDDLLEGPLQNQTAAPQVPTPIRAPPGFEEPVTPVVSSDLRRT